MDKTYVLADEKLDYKTWYAIKSVKPSVLGLAFAFVMALNFAFLSYFALYLGVGIQLLEALSSLYTGYHADNINGIGIGFIWGFVDGYTTGFLLALFYRTSFRPYESASDDKNG